MRIRRPFHALPRFFKSRQDYRPLLCDAIASPLCPPYPSQFCSETEPAANERKLTNASSPAMSFEEGNQVHWSVFLWLYRDRTSAHPPSGAFCRLASATDTLVSFSASAAALAVMQDETDLRAHCQPARYHEDHYWQASQPWLRPSSRLIPSFAATGPVYFMVSPSARRHLVRVNAAVSVSPTRSI